MFNRQCKVGYAWKGTEAVGLLRESASVLVFSDRNREIAVLPTGGIATRVPPIPIFTNTSDPDNRITDTDITVW